MGRVWGAVQSLTDFGTYLHALRLAHFYAYSHVWERRKMSLGPDVSFAPNVSFRNGERIAVGEGTHIGEHSLIWAGNTKSRIKIGRRCLIAPRVSISASNYGTKAGTPMMDQLKVEQDIVIGDDVWLGVNTVVTAGVTIGSGAVVGAGAVVTHDVPPNAIVGGVPARTIGVRDISSIAECRPTGLKHSEVESLR